MQLEELEQQRETLEAGIEVSVVDRFQHDIRQLEDQLQDKNRVFMSLVFVTGFHRRNMLQCNLYCVVLLICTVLYCCLYCASYDRCMQSSPDCCLFVA